ncbi:amidohydrolase family protein [Kribbella sp. NPDC055110]
MSCRACTSHRARHRPGTRRPLTHRSQEPIDRPVVQEPRGSRIGARRGGRGGRRGRRDRRAHALVSCELTSLRAIDEVAELIDGARQSGLDVTTEAYPYGAGMTTVGVPFLHPDHLPRPGIEPSNLSIVATGERPKDAARLLQIRQEMPGALVIIHYLDEDKEEDVSLIRRALLMRDTAVASDAIPFTTPAGLVVEGDRALSPDASSHPRTTGTFARFLRTTVRESGALSLPEALRRCSLLPANILTGAVPAMARKGRVQVGADADLVVVDPEQVSDRSTYAGSQTSSTGFEHVLVAGQAVVRDGDVVATALPGRPVVRGAR